jgi:predicted ATPase
LALRWADEAYAIAKDQAMTYVAEIVVPWWRGKALIEHGEYEAGYAEVTLGADAWRSGGGVLLLPFSDLMRAKALIALGRLLEAQVALSLALDVTDRTGHRMYEAEIHRVTGLFHEKQSSLDLAEAAYARSIAVAKSQDAKGFQLRSATSLARLWRTQDKRREAYELLAPVYNWFTEGHDTRDLREAAALLQELS